MITIYGASWCSWCHKAKELAERYGLQHTWKDIEVPTIYEEYLNESQNVKNFGRFTIPQIFWGTRYIGGYDAFASEIENTIGGYGDGKI